MLFLSIFVNLTETGVMWEDRHLQDCHSDQTVDMSVDHFLDCYLMQEITVGNVIPRKMGLYKEIAEQASNQHLSVTLLQF